MATDSLDLFEVFIRSKRGLDHTARGQFTCGTTMNRHLSMRVMYIPVVAKQRRQHLVVKSSDIVSSQEEDSESFTIRWTTNPIPSRDSLPASRRSEQHERRGQQNEQ